MKKAYLAVAAFMIGATLTVLSVEVKAQASIEPGDSGSGTVTCYSTYNSGETTIHKCENGCGTTCASGFTDKQDCTY